MIYEIRSGRLMVSFRTSIFLLIFCLLALLITDSCVEVSIYNFVFIHFISVLSILFLCILKLCCHLHIQDFIIWNYFFMLVNFPFFWNLPCPINTATLDFFGLDFPWYIFFHFSIFYLYYLKWTYYIAYNWVMYL